MNWVETLREIVEEEQGKREMVAIKRSGRGAENNAIRALKILRKRKIIPFFLKTPKFSEEDKSGIDIIIKTFRGKKIFLQVKAHISYDEAKSLGLAKIYHGIWKKGEIYYIATGGKETLKRTIAKISKIIEIEK